MIIMQIWCWCRLQEDSEGDDFDPGDDDDDDEEDDEEDDEDEQESAGKEISTVLNVYL